MAGKSTSSKADILSAIPNISKASAVKLVAANLDTIAKVAGSSQANLVKAGLSAAVAKKVKAAAESAKGASEKAKSTAKKAK